MAVTITITTIPIGSILTSTIASDEPESKNDFRVRIITSENGTGLTESNITFSTGASLVSLTGSKSVWEATIRPPETEGTLTITIGADAFTEGNAETTHDIRVSTSFPDTDAEVPTELFDTGDSFSGFTLTPSRILTSDRPNTTTFRLQSYMHDGTAVTGETVTVSIGFSSGSNVLDFINGDVLMARGNPSPRFERRRLSDLSVVIDFGNTGYAMHTEFGYARFVSNTTLRILPYNFESTADYTEISVSTFFSQYNTVGHQDGLLYFTGNFAAASDIKLVELIDENTIEFKRSLNIDTVTTGFVASAGMAFYRDTLYMGTSSGSIRTLDIRPYRPLAKNTKTTIYPVFANEGDTLPLKQYCPDAHTITFGTGFDKPTYLSINADNELEIASNAVTETQPVLVRFTGINYIDSVDFQFYLIIVQAANPTVRDVADLAMYANTTFNLFDIVDNATAITFRSGQTQPTGSSISNGVFTIGTAGGTAYFTATNANGSTNFEIAIDVVSVDPDNFSDTFRYRTEIAGIDVSADVKGTPTVSESIDEVRLNVVTANRVNLTLRSDSTNGFKFNGGLADNFWDANSLNADGFQEPIKVYIESLISGSYVRSLLVFR